MSEREQLLCKLSAAQFAALEMLLYMDTHKHDHAAFKRLKEYLEQVKECRKQFTEKYGPLNAADLYGDTRFEWVNAPWPWETEREAKN